MTLRYWASVRAVAGASEETVPAGTLAEVLAAARDRHDVQFSRVLGVCSVLVDERPVRLGEQADLPIAPGSVVDLLPPFAGG